MFVEVVLEGRVVLEGLGIGGDNVGGGGSLEMVEVEERLGGWVDGEGVGVGLGEWV